MCGFPLSSPIIPPTQKNPPKINKSHQNMCKTTWSDCSISIVLFIPICDCEHFILDW